MIRRLGIKLTITTVGNSSGLIVPKDVLSRLHLQKGDEFHLLETPDGFRITTYAPDFAAKMDVI